MTAPTLEVAPGTVDFGDPSARRRTRLRVVGAGLGILAVGLLVWIAFFSSLLSATSIRIVGVDGAPADAAAAAAAVPLGVPLARLDAGAAERAVLRLPWVSSVEVRRGWPNEVVIAVEPRVAIAARTVDGARQAVDRDGVVFDLVGAVPKGLPTVDAEGIGLASAMAVLATLPADIAARVASLSATTRDDVDLVLRSGTTVRWGSVEQTDFKAEVLRALMRHKRDVYDVSAPELPTTFTSR
ncbi:MAG: FtsQ-type POTRA domain-containing protein [Actinobacteria bacterium]|nr:FtsQ-type POTRA domain-containing protein [Actinomycetota bacterium]